MRGFNKCKDLLLFIVFFILGLSAEAQNDFRIVFYNVENLYDVKDNPETNDDDFTLEGQLHWSNYRYWTKLTNISRVISSAGGAYPPALIGMCEVENDSVLYDLTKRSALQKDKYDYIISKSKDHRGSNVALLYQRDEIKILNKTEYTPVLNSDSSKTTRNILHVTGRIINKDTLDIFVCHFPSRSEGLKKTKPYRVKCSQLLRQKADSLFRIREKANIIIMGDFNDYPNDYSLFEVLGAKSVRSAIMPRGLYNMFYDKISEGGLGTYKYRGKWNFIDQFIVSGNLLDASSSTVVKGRNAYVHSLAFLLEDDVKNADKKPFRTYWGFKYLGGYSDHLPIYIDLKIK